MWTLKILLVTEWIAIVNSLDAVICETYPVVTVTIDCGPDGIIYVQSMTAAYIYNMQNCKAQYIIDTIHNKKVQKSVHVSVGCHGSRQCVIPSDAGVFWVDGRRTNTAHLRYTCVKMDRTLTAVLPIYQDVTNSELHIFSPNYPDQMPSSPFNFSCDVNGPDSSQFIVIEKLYFDSGGNCDKELFFLQNGSLPRETVCSSPTKEVEQWQHSVSTSGHTLTLTYDQKTDVKGGLFWIRVLGYLSGNLGYLTITCPDQDQIPGYDPPTTTTTTPTTTPTLTSGRPTSDPGSPIEGFTSDDNDNSDSTLYGIIGGCLCVILIAAIVIAFLIYKLRKRRSTDQANGDVNSAKVNPAGPSVENPDGAGGGTVGGEYAEIAEGEPGYTNLPRMYTTPIVPKYENSPNVDNGNMDTKYENVNDGAIKDNDEYEHVSTKGNGQKNV